MTGKNFILIGAAGYVAPRHLQAIKDTGNNLVAALDIHDSVGILDKYFPQAAFFTEFERFDRHVDKLRRKGFPVHFLSVCSPNYLHDAHVRFGLRSGLNVICEKPLVINPWNLAGLQELAEETGHQVYPIMQMRLHDQVNVLRQWIDSAPDQKHGLLTYITPRGIWYHSSWKGDLNKSGGIITNIGFHLFDLLLMVFGPVLKKKTFLLTHDRASGVLYFKQATISWFLSISDQTLPQHALAEGKTTYRVLEFPTRSFDFSDNFTNLHTLSYQNILSGQGFNISDVESSIELTHDLRHTPLENQTSEAHPMAILPQLHHPFETRYEN